MSFGGENEGKRKICDLDHLLVNLRRNKAATERLVRLFLENYPRHLQRLEETARQRDLAALKDAVHDIRSSCVLFSAEVAVDIARDIETAIHRYAGDGAEIDWEGKAEALRDALAILAAQLCNYLDENSS